jgi:hypothetical protein
MRLPWSPTVRSAYASHKPDPAMAGIAALAYELLDAHADTAQLADRLSHDRSWAAHLDYLRALQRKGRELLARTDPGTFSYRRSTAGGWLDVR